MASIDPYPDDHRMRQVYNLLERRIEERWGLAVVISDVPDPFTGDLDGAEISVDYDQEIEDALFILVHLFGHTVQWNTDPRAREIGGAVEANPSDQRMAQLEAYEQEACRYSLTLLHECGIHDFDPWLADFAHCDFAYLAHFYRTGEKRPFRSFWKPGAPILDPLPLPAFEPTRWVARSDGVVL